MAFSMCEDTFLDRAWLTQCRTAYGARGKRSSMASLSILSSSQASELKEDTEASMGKDSMCRSGENMIVRKPL